MELERDRHEVMTKLWRLGELLHRHGYRKHRMHGPMGDPHRGQGRVLALLKLRPEISQRDLSYLLDIRPQSLGELLAKLEKSGFIERTPSESDRRGMDISLTEEGARASEGVGGSDESPFASLNPEELTRFCAYLDRIIAELEEKLADDRDGECGGGHRHSHRHGHHGEWHPGMDRPGREAGRHRHGPGHGCEEGGGGGHSHHGRCCNHHRDRGMDQDVRDDA